MAIPAGLAERMASMAQKPRRQSRHSSVIMDLPWTESSDRRPGASCWDCRIIVLVQNARVFYDLLEYTKSMWSWDLAVTQVGVTGCRIIDSPRERLIAIITNNFVPCNGRFPMLLSIISMFLIGNAAGIFSSFLSLCLLAGVHCAGNSDDAASIPNPCRNS